MLKKQFTGHTQFTDIEQPITSQLILSDGKEFYFAIGQLNTIAINIEAEGNFCTIFPYLYPYILGFDNPRTNFCCVEGPFMLYDAFDQRTKSFSHRNIMGKREQGLNKHVLKRLLQMFNA
jgi:hypothetical protein